MMAGFENLRFDGKTLLVTGGSQGIGAATARLAARRGARVMIASPDPDGLAAVAEEIRGAGGLCDWVLCDVTDSEEVRAMVARTVETFGRLDAAYNNAGISHPPAMPHELDDALFDRVMAVNVRGVFACARAEIRQFLSQGRGGVIVNNGSMAGIVGVGTMAPYAASKHAVAGLTRSLALAYGPVGIRCNFQGPGATETPMYNESIGNVIAFRKSHPDLAVPSKLKGPLNRNQSPEEQAEVACFLLSDASSAMTGALVIADGGATAY